VAVALGNALRLGGTDASHRAMRTALQRHSEHPSLVVREHVRWALQLNDAEVA
jgi:hypothetical protein